LLVCTTHSQYFVALGNNYATIYCEYDYVIIGGGGTFVALGENYATATPLIVAGGGSGSDSNSNGGCCGSDFIIVIITIITIDIIMNQLIR
jgi:hypothetical protein